jgi:hypothetical protein
MKKQARRNTSFLMCGTLFNIVQHCSTLFNNVITRLIIFQMTVLVMQKVETLAIALSVFVMAGLAMYALDILNVPGTDDLLQQADAIRRSTNQCATPIFGGCQ